MTDNVILVGFMGAGKSSVGRILARRLGRCFVETDAMIVGKEGVSIPEIFAKRSLRRLWRLTVTPLNPASLRSFALSARNHALVVMSI